MAEDHQLKLLGLWASPYSIRVELVLKLKRLQYRYIEEKSSKSSLLLESNPVLKKIPVFFHEGKTPIAESLIIVEYIDEIWRQSYPVLPEDPGDRAAARFWAKFIDETGKEKEEAVEEYVRLLKVLEAELKGKDYFGGERIGFLDVAAIHLHFFELLQEEEGDDRLMKPETFPALFKWLEKFRSNDAVRECLPPADKLLRYSRVRRAALLQESAPK
ncbi:Glutathione S-transferase U7 [Linum grandiflorum]